MDRDKRKITKPLSNELTSYVRQMSEPEFARLMEPFYELDGMDKVLSRDLQKCISRLKLKESQFWRRAFARAEFAWIEGVCHCMKCCAFAGRFQEGVKFSTGELQFLSGMRFQLGDGGVVKEQPIKTNFLYNIQFSFRVFAMIHYAEYKLSTSDAQWKTLRDSVKIRNRLMHPKNKSDLIVSNVEEIILLDTHEWFLCKLAQLMELCVQPLRQLRGRDFRKLPPSLSKMIH